LPGPVETALYRCVQESLTNVARHAEASTVNIKFKKQNGLLMLDITDDGIGFDPEKHNKSSDSIGLIGMHERIKLLDGEFRIDSSKGRGTKILIRVPC